MALSFKIPKSGAIAMLVTGVVYTALSLPQLITSTVTVPVAKSYLGRGTTLAASDIGYSKIGSTPFKLTPGMVLKTSMVPGEILTNATVGRASSDPIHSGVLVAVVPSQAADLAVAKPGNDIRVVLIPHRGQLWRSPVERVLSLSGSGGVLGGGPSSIIIRLPLSLADQYLSLLGQSTVFVVGAP